MPRTGFLLLSLLLGWAAPSAGFDHAAYGRLLREGVHGGMVDYDAFASSTSFLAYLRSLDAVRPDLLDPDERLAYWINVYNAFTIQLVASSGERTSILNLAREAGSPGGGGPFKQPVVRAAGRVLSLDQVEHEIIRKEFREPRVHFALVCAAMSCPRLRSEAYTGSQLGAQLEDQARLFILSSPSKNLIDAARGVAHLSPIFDWYLEDFGGTREALGHFLARYFPKGPEKEVLESGRFRVEYTNYDWALNGNARP
jgi:hypothetical protein